MLSAHSGFRYLVLLLGLAVMAYAAYGVIAKRPYDTRMRALSAAFTGTLDVTLFLGIATLLFGVDFYPRLGGHVVMMVFAAAVAHVVSGVMKRRPPEERTYMPHLVGTAVALGLVVAGIAAIGRSVIG